MALLVVLSRVSAGMYSFALGAGAGRMFAVRRECYGGRRGRFSVGILEMIHCVTIAGRDVGCDRERRVGGWRSEREGCNLRNERDVLQDSAH